MHVLGCVSQERVLLPAAGWLASLWSVVCSRTGAWSVVFLFAFVKYEYLCCSLSQAAGGTAYRAGTFPLRRVVKSTLALSTFRWRKRLRRHYRSRPAGGQASEAIRPVEDA